MVPQKSGMAYALDPDKQGAIVWQYRVSARAAAAAASGAARPTDGRLFRRQRLPAPAAGGIVAVDLATGERVWQHAGGAAALRRAGRECNAAQGAAVTAIPGAVLSGSHDGGLRAYAAEGRHDPVAVRHQSRIRDGQRRQGQRRQHGRAGRRSSPADMLFVNSGYGGIVGRPGNVLLVFGVD